jgi:hypothetical protein
MILADVLKRWQVLKGKKALLSVGVDEHGMKVRPARTLPLEHISLPPFPSNRSWVISWRIELSRSFRTMIFRSREDVFFFQQSDAHMSRFNERRRQQVWIQSSFATEPRMPLKCVRAGKEA